MTVDAIMRQQEKLAEHWLLCYEYFKAEREFERAAVIDATAKPAEGGKSTAGSNEPLNKAIRLSQDWDDDKIIATIEMCEQAFPENYRRLLHIRRAMHGTTAARIVPTGRPAWIEEAILRYADQTGTWIRPNVMSLWWRSIVERTARVAAWKGCYK